MSMRVNNIIALLLASSLFVPLFSSGSAEQEGDKVKIVADADDVQRRSCPPLPGPGKKFPVGDGFYLIYSFDKKPALGIVTMKVRIYTRKGKKDTSLEVYGDASMPSIRGAYETGDRAFKITPKGDYLLPVNIAKPGEWEIRLTILKKGKVISQCRYNFVA
ncbi:MAG: hypothetical protein PHN75_11375 [Syntrophales bacterium]|nr:hypothetical protein [Syntrophales bacterium]